MIRVNFAIIANIRNNEENMYASEFKKDYNQDKKIQNTKKTTLIRHLS